MLNESGNSGNPTNGLTSYPAFIQESEFINVRVAFTSAKVFCRAAIKAA